MSLINTITVDLENKTIILNSSSSGILVENITYSQSLNQITFLTRPDIVISGVDFLDLTNQINIFQTAILFNFAPNIFATIPFNSCNNTENHDSVNNLWDLACIYGASPRVINYSGILSNKTIDLKARASSKVLEYPEWTYLLTALIHYRLSIRNFFSL